MAKLKMGWRDFARRSDAKKSQKEARKTNKVHPKIVKTTTYHVMVGMKKKKR